MGPGSVSIKGLRELAKAKDEKIVSEIVHIQNLECKIREIRVYKMKNIAYSENKSDKSFQFASRFRDSFNALS